jgi:hypothetical protein
MKMLLHSYFHLMAAVFTLVYTAGMEPKYAIVLQVDHDGACCEGCVCPWVAPSPPPLPLLPLQPSHETREVPSPPPAPVEPTDGSCASWCPFHTADWDTKCKAYQPCRGCVECPAAECEPWCTRPADTTVGLPNTDWYTKCTAFPSCRGCLIAHAGCWRHWHGHVGCGGALPCSSTQPPTVLLTRSSCTGQHRLLKQR